MAELDQQRIHRVQVLGRESVFIGTDFTDAWITHLLANVQVSAYVLVTDTIVGPLYFDRIKSRFPKPLLSFFVPPGEASKTRRCKESIEDFMLENGCTRDTCLLALGGGVIGDMVGFVAATFMRGIPFVQLPTTLLSMVDASVGGKTAVDTPHGKNLVGAFWQPKFVYMDTLVLRSLPKRQFINGMAEIIKTAAFWDAEEFAFLEENVDRILDIANNTGGSSDMKILERIIRKSVEVKAYVVTKDERETGLRGLLNFGHSVGHAIEAVYTPQLLHGEAIAIGMVKEAEIARHLGHISQVNLGRIVRCLKHYELPTSLDDALILRIEGETGKQWSVERLLDIMKVDKKNKGSKKRLVLLKSIGKTVEQQASFVEDEVIKKTLAPAVFVQKKHVFNDTATEIKVDVPGSKSISNRVLLLAALEKGRCRIHGLLHSDDTQVMLQALQQLMRCSFQWENEGEVLVMEGSGGVFYTPSKPLYLGNAGTAARFLTTMATLVPGASILTGNNRMKQRPIAPLVEALRANGCKIDFLESQGCLPLNVHGVRLKGGLINLSASISSQYVSSILISASYAENDVELVLGNEGDNKVVSQPYIDMTVAMMAEFGLNVHRKANNVYVIKKGVYQNPADYFVEKDASSATYPLAVAAITGCKVTVPHLGSKSLQGDARFALDILKRMGCQVQQSETSTTVIGPPFGTLKPIPSVDMEPLTDAFLTASVLAACAQGGTTKITGIANQRVKECNRILAMVTELKKFGIDSWELADGIEIQGKHPTELIRPSSVHCYDDHRVAMSFSVLATAMDLNGVLIEEKKCVEKTWPTWWLTLEQVLGVPFDYAEEVAHEKMNKYPRRSIVLIGLRGVGKTNMGRVAAEHMKYKFFDLDIEMEKEVGALGKFIDAKGWQAFRELETKIFERTVQSNSTGAVISTGGGIVESEANRMLLKKTGDSLPVVWIKRNADDVIAELEQDPNRPSLGESMKTVWERRRPLYAECSNMCFSIVKDSDGYHWNRVNNAWSRFLDSVISGKFHVSYEGALVRNWQDQKTSSFFLSLTLPNLKPKLTELKMFTSTVDTVELRVDLLESCDLDFVEEQVSLLRHFQKKPIIFTVRTTSQGGKFDVKRFDHLKQLVSLGIRLGCEFVDVELNWSAEFLRELKQSKRQTRLISSFHDKHTVRPWQTIQTQLASIVELAVDIGDIVKLVMTAESVDDNLDLFKLLSDPSSFLGCLKKPLIAINMGRAGQMTRVLNKTLTPVTHAQLEKAAPGQLTVEEVHQARALLGITPKLNFYLFGCPITHSMSPCLHNTGFKVLGLNNSFYYQLYETASTTPELLQLIKSSEFGGASVTIPLKEALIPHVSQLSQAAKKIGAINTLLACPEGLLGDNTDWLGITRVIKKHCSSFNKIVIIGAGGTARAAIFAAVNLVGSQNVGVFNRTAEKAAKLAIEFGIKHIASLSEEQADIIITTIPGDAQQSLLSQLKPLLSKGGKLIVELAYKPRQTDFIREAEAHGWGSVPGIDILIEQGFEQFQLFTGREPPTAEMRSAVYSTYHA